MKTCKAYNPYDMLNKENIYKSLNNKHEIEIFDKISPDPSVELAAEGTALV